MSSRVRPRLMTTILACGLFGCATAARSNERVSSIAPPIKYDESESPCQPEPEPIRLAPAAPVLHPAADEAPQVWPEQLAGRQRQVLRDHYVLYANDPTLAANLDRWLNRQLEMHTRQCRLPDGRGLVLTVEAGAEPFPALEQWRQSNVSRARVIHWVSDHRRGFMVRTRKGRPYSFFKEPYFRESFALTREEAVRIGILGVTTPKPAWICVLTTGAHVTEAFTQKIRQHNQELNRAAAEYRKTERPGDNPPGHVMAERMFYLMYKLSVPTYRSIDIDMMRLQRREVLKQTLIRHSDMDEARRRDALSRLRDETDEAWKELYFSRPVD